MKIKVSETTPIQLDWLVAKCEGWEYDNIRNARAADRSKRYTTSWAQGGPLIERERIQTWKDDCSKDWIASAFDDVAPYSSGPTLLIAAMRCLVASKLGDEVEVPKELVCADMTKVKS
jgi:hypothetical protein